MADEIAEDEITTLQEALEAEELLENQTVAVLGASDPQNCSYSKVSVEGYVKRQALYACLTCNPKGAPFAQPAGICLACTYKCHEGHELVELFTKRNFRCDCGNKKFPDNPCQLQKEKDDLNTENVYNQNFDGLYCSCHRPYPDPDPTNEAADDPMIQCIICEDWVHFRHSLSYLKTDFEAMDDDFELICGPCMKRLDFLGHYADLSIKPAPVVIPASQSTCENESENIIEPLTDSGSAKIVGSGTAKDHVEDSSSLDSGMSSLSGSENSTDVPTCHLQKNAKEVLPSSETNAVAWKGKLRSSLCRCLNCTAMYEKLKIQFLLDAEDTIEHYEALGKKVTEDAQLSAEASMNEQVNNLGHVGKLEFLYGINQFKDQLADFLKEHAESGRTVRREDVLNFFEKVKEESAAAKRRRLQ